MARMLFGVIAAANVIYIGIVVGIISIWFWVINSGYAAVAAGDSRKIVMLIITSIVAIVVVKFSPLAITVQMGVGYLYSLLPGQGSTNAREDILNVSKKIDNLWLYIGAAFFTPLIFMYVASLGKFTFANGSLLSIVVATICFVVYAIATGKSWKNYWKICLGFFILIILIAFFQAYPDAKKEVGIDAFDPVNVIRVIKNTPEKVIDSVKNIFTGDPKPQIIDSVEYSPRINGPGWMKIIIPGKGPYKLECKGSYRQTFSNGSKEYIKCGGIRNQNMPSISIKSMPIEDPRQYGMFLKREYENYALVNINIPQNEEEYSDIVGSLHVSIIR